MLLAENNLLPLCLKTIMMLKHKQKKWRQIRLFIFGILIGSLVGVSIFWWISYYSHSEWFFTKKINNWIENLFSSSAELDKQKALPYPTENIANQKKNIVEEDSNSIDEYSDEFFYENSEPLVFSDTISDTSYENNQDNSTEQTNVRKDELLLVKDFLFNNDKDLLLDSLMGVTSKGQESVSVSVEFWKSPINFRGYKRSPKKIIIYGAKNHDKAEFKMSEGKLIMIDNNSKYVLRYTNVFLKLEPLKAK